MGLHSMSHSVRGDYPDAVWAEVESSWIAAISFVDAYLIPMRPGVNEEHRVGTMLVETKTGAVYEYHEVHYQVVRAIVLAESVGKALNVLCRRTHNHRE